MLYTRGQRWEGLACSEIKDEGRPSATVTDNDTENRLTV